MKIIKPGREQTGWTTEEKCTGAGNGGGGCGAVLLVEQGDIYRTFRHCRDERDEFHTFACSACGVETDLAKRPPFAAPSKAVWLEAAKREILGRPR